MRTGRARYRPWPTAATWARPRLGRTRSRCARSIRDRQRTGHVPAWNAGWLRRLQKASGYTRSGGPERHRAQRRTPLAGHRDREVLPFPGRHDGPDRDRLLPLSSATRAPTPTGSHGSPRPSGSNARPTRINRPVHFNHGGLTKLAERLGRPTHVSHGPLPRRAIHSSRSERRYRQCLPILKAGRTPRRLRSSTVEWRSLSSSATSWAPRIPIPPSSRSRVRWSCRWRGSDESPFREVLQSRLEAPRVNVSGAARLSVLAR